MFDLTRLADSRNKIAVFVLNLVAGAAVIGAAAWFSYTIFSEPENSSPRVIQSISLEPVVLRPGDHFNVHLVEYLTRVCGRDIVHWSLVRVTDNIIVVQVLEQVQNDTEVPGTNHLVHERIVPLGMTPGRYYYVATVEDDCEGHAFFTAESPVPLTIIPPT